MAVGCRWTDRENNSHGCVVNPAAAFLSGFAVKIRGVHARIALAASCTRGNTAELRFRNMRHACDTLKRPRPEEIIITISTITKGILSKHAPQGQQGWILAAMEEDVPVCDRFLAFRPSAHTQLMISLAIVLIRNSLRSPTGGTKNKVEDSTDSRRIDLFRYRLTSILYFTHIPHSLSVPGLAPLRTLSPPE